MVDLHFHLLPTIDDGPRDMDESLRLARAAVAGGTSTVVATPHVSWRWEANDAASIADAVLRLRLELEAHAIDLDVRPGAEVALTRAMDMPMEELDLLRLAGSPWLLIECPDNAVPDGLEISLRRLLHDGHRIMLAHPERIRAFHERPELLSRFVAGGVRCQVTASALSGGFGAAAKRFGTWMLGEGLAHLAVSDAHSVHGRPPSLRDDLRQAGLDEPLIEWLARDAPRALLEGHELPRPQAAGAGGVRTGWVAGHRSEPW